MSVNIIKKHDSIKGIKAREMKDGRAYTDALGTIYIGSTVPTADDVIKAFSVCGKTIVWESDEEFRYIEIDLDIIVK